MIQYCDIYLIYNNHLLSTRFFYIIHADLFVSVWCLQDISINYGVIRRDSITVWGTENPAEILFKSCRKGCGKCFMSAAKQYGQRCISPLSQHIIGLYFSLATGQTLNSGCFKKRKRTILVYSSIHPLLPCLLVI